MLKRTLIGAVMAGTALTLAACKEEEKAVETSQTETTNEVVTQAPAVVEVETAPAVEVTLPESATELLENADEKINEAADKALDAASELLENTEALSGEATTAVKDTLNQAKDALVNTTEEVTAEAAEAAQNVVSNVSETVANVAETTENVGNIANVFDAGMASEILNVENFNLEKAIEYIDLAPVSDEIKNTIKGSIEQAAGNPAILKQILETAKTMLNL